MRRPISILAAFLLAAPFVHAEVLPLNECRFSRLISVPLTYSFVILVPRLTGRRPLCFRQPSPLHGRRDSGTQRLEPRGTHKNQPLVFWLSALQMGYSFLPSFLPPTLPSTYTQLEQGGDSMPQSFLFTGAPTSEPIAPEAVTPAPTASKEEEDSSTVTSSPTAVPSVDLTSAIEKNETAAPTPEPSAGGSSEGEGEVDAQGVPPPPAGSGGEAGGAHCSGSASGNGGEMIPKATPEPEVVETETPAATPEASLEPVEPVAPAADIPEATSAPSDGTAVPVTTIVLELAGSAAQKLQATTVIVAEVERVLKTEATCSSTRRALLPRCCSPCVAGGDGGRLVCFLGDAQECHHHHLDELRRYGTCVFLIHSSFFLIFVGPSLSLCCSSFTLFSHTPDSLFPPSLFHSFLGGGLRALERNCGRHHALGPRRRHRRPRHDLQGGSKPKNGEHSHPRLPHGRHRQGGERQ